MQCMGYLAKKHRRPSFSRVGIFTIHHCSFRCSVMFVVLLNWIAGTTLMMTICVSSVQGTQSTVSNERRKHFSSARKPSLGSYDTLSFPYVCVHLILSSSIAEDIVVIILVQPLTTWYLWRITSKLQVLEVHIQQSNLQTIVLHRIDQFLGLRGYRLLM